MQCEEILKAARFVFDPSREVWFSRGVRKLFTHEVLREHNSEWVKSKLLEDVSENEFRFYRMKPDIQVCIETLERMHLSHLIPVESLG